jgi:hypothetical protein
VPSARERPRTGLGDEPFTSPSYTGPKAAQSPFGPARNGLGPLIRLWGLQPTPETDFNCGPGLELASTHVVSQSR